MSRSWLVNLLVAAVLSFGPLLGATDRMLHPGPWLSFIAAAVILISQPPVGPREMAKADPSDRRSALGIFVCNISVGLIAAFDFGYREALRPPPVSAVTLVAALLIAGGLALRLWSIHTLGKFFTSTVMKVDGHQLIETGPYRRLRHPSYTGALLSVLGIAVGYGSWIAVIGVFVVAVPGYLYRIRTEEAKLREIFGDTYASYTTRSARLVPWIY
jgi:protein-S-isoprenylcysteine O-methyltransferase Ste14